MLRGSYQPYNLGMGLGLRVAMASRRGEQGELKSERPWEPSSWESSPRFLLKGSLEGDIDIGIDKTVDTDVELDAQGT